jgi:hypothetical protein
VAGALAEDELNLQRVVYDIESGDFRIYCPKRRALAPLADVDVDELRPDPLSQAYSRSPDLCFSCK